MKTYIWELIQKILYIGWFIHEHVYMGTDKEDTLIKVGLFMKTYIWELIKKIVYRGWFIHENVYMGTDTEDSLQRLVYS